MSITIRLKRKYTTPYGAKSIKNTKAGNGKRARGNGVSWRAGTGTGKETKR